MFFLSVEAALPSTPHLTAIPWPCSGGVASLLLASRKGYFRLQTIIPLQWAPMACWVVAQVGVVGREEVKTSGKSMAKKRRTANWQMPLDPM